LLFPLPFNIAVKIIIFVCRNQWQNKKIKEFFYKKRQENEKLVEVHENYPIDKGHIKIKNDDNNKTATGN
jgi:hypothetical protein